eukprot:2293475-Amphidinium_carterae.1
MGRKRKGNLPTPFAGELSIPYWDSFMESAVMAICHSAPAVCLMFNGKKTHEDLHSTEELKPNDTSA